MDNYTIYYCYDAYCGWCYGFSPVIKRIEEEYKEKLFFEVLSGGMIIADKPRHIRATADYIRESCKRVEELTGIRFGEDYLWHINNPEESDWFPNSEKPAIALCIFKEYYPEMQVAFATDLGYALHEEGRDLCDNEAYRHLLEKYNIPAEEFYDKLKSEEYKEKAYYEFALVKQLQVQGYPAVLLQANESKFYMIASGYTNYNTVKATLDGVLKDIME